MNGVVFPIPADQAEEIREAVGGNIELCESAIRRDPKKRLVDAEQLMPFLKLVQEAFDEE
jgi:hypothetical protein